jgi:hypothetical protein
VATDETKDAPRKRPRLGIIVRVLIYVPLLAFFGWQAVQKLSSQRDVADDNFRTLVQQRLDSQLPTVMLPNGEVIPAITEEQAIEMGVLPTPSEAPKPEPAPEPTQE